MAAKIEVNKRGQMKRANIIWGILAIVSLALLGGVLWLASRLADPFIFYLLRDSPGKSVRRLGNTGSWHGPVAFSVDGKLLAVAAEEGIELWHVPYGVFPEIVASEDRVTSLAFSPDGQILAVGLEGGRVELWQVWGWKLLRTLDGGTKPAVEVVVFSPDGILLAGATYDRALLWRVSDGAFLSAWPVQWRVNDMAFSPDGALLAVANTYRWSPEWFGVNILRVMDGTLLRAVRTRPGAGGEKVVFSPDGAWLATAGRSGIEVWRTVDWTLQQELPVYGIVSFSQDSSMMGVASGQTVWLCRLVDGLCAYRLHALASSGNAATTLSADGTFAAIVTFSDLWLWNTAVTQATTWLPPGEVVEVAADAPFGYFSKETSDAIVLGCLGVLAVLVLIPLTLYGLSMKTEHVWETTSHNAHWISGYYVEATQGTRRCMRCGATMHLGYNKNGYDELLWEQPCKRKPLPLLLIQATVLAVVGLMVAPIIFALSGVLLGFCGAMPTLPGIGFLLGIIYGFFGGWYAGITDNIYRPRRINIAPWAK